MSLFDGWIKSRFIAAIGVRRGSVRRQMLQRTCHPRVRTAARLSLMVAQQLLGVVPPPCGRSRRIVGVQLKRDVVGGGGHADIFREKAILAGVIRQCVVGGYCLS